MQPSVLLLDEPTAGLDPCGESQMIDLLLDLNRRRKTTLIVATHCVDLLPVLADRVCVLSQGRVWQEGSPHEIFHDPHHIARAGLRSPLVAQLFHRLQDYPGMAVDRLPLTVTEAQEQILRWLEASSTSY
jgi:cobalt/nickel transport system ATP-binding protein